MPQRDPTPALELRRLRFASMFEGTTLLVLLLVAVPLKHIAGWDVAVKVMGPLHGLAFLIYTWLAINVVTTANGNWKEIARYIGLAVVPLGGFFGAAKLAQKSARSKEGNRV